MSATTLVDLTDAQMLDYSMDADFSMHNSPAEWLAIEATMSDDNPVSAATDYSETIEIDMEAGDDFDGEITEYEMADGVGDDVDYDGDAQLQDAEVDDPHQHESSLVIDPTPAVQPDDTGLPPYETSRADQHSSLPPSERLDTASDIAIPSTLPAATHNTDAAHTDHTHFPLSLHVEVPASTYDEAHPSDTTSVGLSENFLQTNAALIEPPTIIISAPSNDPSDEIEAFNEAIDPSEAPAIHEAERLASEEPALSREGEHEEQGGNAGENIAHEACSHPTEHIETVDAESASARAETAGNEGDPHEISDGVYIDPPPAVLFSISGHDGDDFCLFNHPRSSSRSQSPENEASSSMPSTLVLLQQHPTRYYEPLSYVFGALRQEESIHRISQFASLSNELTLEAYDLDLTFSEV